MEQSIECVQRLSAPVWRSQKSDSNKRPPSTVSASPAVICTAGRDSVYPPVAPRALVTSPPRRRMRINLATYSGEMPSARLISGMVRLPPSPCAPRRSKQRSPYSSCALSFIFASSGDAVQSTSFSLRDWKRQNPWRQAKACTLNSEHSKLELCRLRHVVHAPRRVPNQFNLRASHAWNGPHFLLDFSRQTARDRTTGGGQCHSYIHFA